MLKISDIEKAKFYRMPQQQIIYLIQLTKAYMKEDNGMFYYYDNNSMNDNYMQSRWLVKLNSTKSYINKTEQQIFEKIEHEMTVEKIIKAINGIVLEENRRVFIQRFYYGYSINKIMNINFIGQKYYYRALKEATEEFLNLLKIKNRL